MKLLYQDAHLHLQDPVLLANLDSVIKVARKEGVTHMVVNGTSPDDWQEVANLASAYPDFILPSYGVHPWNASKGFTGEKAALIKRVNEQRNACIGECGLDLWMQNPDRAAQERVFRYHLELAAERNLPITVHVLKAWGWLMDVLQSSSLPERGFLLHSYSGSVEFAQRLVTMGAYFSFSGYFLHSRKRSVQQVFQQLPKERILIETDAPSMSLPMEYELYPLPNQQNHPANIVAVGKGLARLRDVSEAELAAQLSNNFQRFFLERSLS